MSEHTLDVSLLEEFARFLRREGRSPGTVEKYQRDTGEFLRELGGEPVSAEVVMAWKERLLSSGLVPATVNSKLSALNGLFRFLGWEDCRAAFLKVQRRVFRDSCRDLSRGEYERLLAAARSTGRGRLELLLETICGTGIRVSEVRYITVEAALAGRADIALKGKIRTLLLPGKLCRKLLQYAKKHKTASGEIFVTKSGRGLSRGQIWREMKGLCEAAGVAPSKVFPHNLRHLFAAVFYRVHKDIARLADLLGHSSINTTRIYLVSTGEEHARQLERLGLIT